MAKPEATICIADRLADDYDISDPKTTAIDPELMDAIAGTCGATGVGLFFAMLLLTKRERDITVTALCEMTAKANAGQVKRVVMDMEDAGFVAISDRKALRTHVNPGNWWSRNIHRYPEDWKTIANGVKEAAGWKCEACGNPHGKTPYVLTVDHVVDHDPSNVAPENLAALCQRCHLRRQGMRPKPMTKEEAIERLRRRYEAEQAQATLPGVQ
jgi:5-methylcytosine-specific restriction endonuclease McrA